MDPRHIELCLQEISTIWAQTPYVLRPDSVWIAMHAALMNAATEPTTPIVRAWYLDADRLQARPASDYVRFLSVQTGQGWASGKPPVSAVFHSGPFRTHQIGLASFASVQGTSDIYIDYIWGGTLGRGALYTPCDVDKKIQCTKNLWLA